MQYKGMGEDYVSILQRRFMGMMSDVEMGVVEEMFPVNRTIPGRYSGDHQPVKRTETQGQSRRKDKRRANKT